MTGLYASHNRRRRRKLTYLLFLGTFLFIFLLRSYFVITYNILIKGPWIARHKSEHMRITPERDEFDITFASYSKEPIFSPNTTVPVPPIMHHIYLGSPKPGAMGANHETARQACLALHPGYEFKYWSDFEAEEFVARNYPDLYDIWSSYPFVIQKADSLRYMILYIYGGIFLDLDLECLRPLEPLRQFDFVAPEATPMGISNGFLMVAPKHPFMKFVLDNLPRYNVNWFHLPYAVVMFSTGCHFLSTMLSLFPGRDTMRILWGPDGLHQLSGVVHTPLFNHMGMSSWHSFDGAIITLFKPGHALGIIPFGLLLKVAAFALTIWGMIKLKRRLERNAGKQKLCKYCSCSDRQHEKLHKVPSLEDDVV